MRFNELKIIDPLLRALETEGYTVPTPIQERAIPILLQGRDLLGIAQTGTGKTAAFVIPLLQHLWTVKRAPAPGAPRALIIAPTRELAAQIDQSISAYGRNVGTTHAVVFGGVGQQPQVDALNKGVDILTATTGRLIDLIQQRHVRLEAVEIFILDEADRMLDMGFIRDVRRIVSMVPRKRQTLFFSATMPSEVVDLSRSILTNPVRIEVTPSATTVGLVTQKILFVDRDHKIDVLLELLAQERLERVLIFTRTKHQANKVCKKLVQNGVVADAIHGNKSQNARTTALENFKSGRTRVLVATDIAARGIDIERISHVINFELPNEPESYVHRIGRTARAGATGIAFSLCSSEESDYLRAIEQLIRQKIPIMQHKFHSAMASVSQDSMPVKHYGGHTPRHSGEQGYGRRSNRADGSRVVRHGGERGFRPDPHSTSRRESYARLKLERPGRRDGFSKPIFTPGGPRVDRFSRDVQDRMQQRGKVERIGRGGKPQRRTGDFRQGPKRAFSSRRRK